MKRFVRTLPFRLNHCFFILGMLAFSCFSCKKNSAEIISSSPEIHPPVITSVLKPVTKPVCNASNGYYISLPSNYDTTNQRYPLLVYIPGAGQFGNGSLDLPLLLKDGPAQLAEEKRFPGTFTVNGKTFSLIVFTPQLMWWPSTSSINDCIEFVKSNYRVDSTRIYLSGLSMGAILSCDLGSELPNKLAAIVPMAGVSVDYQSSNRCQQIANNNLPVWAFHSADDPQIHITSAQGFVNKINSFNPGVPAKLTVWPTGGHDAWTRAVEPKYKENGMNIYEWMLQYHR